MAETININTYPIQENIAVTTVNDVTTVNVNIVQSTGAVTSVNEQTGDVVLTPNNIGALAIDGSNANQNIDLGSYNLTANQVEANQGFVSSGFQIIQIDGNTIGFINSSGKVIASLNTATDTIYNYANGHLTYNETIPALQWDGVNIATVNDIPDLSNYATRTYVDTGLGTKQDILTASNTHTFVDSLTAMTTPVDADKMTIIDNSVSLAKKISWANIKATLKTYFDGLYTTTSAVATQITTALTGYATQTYVNSQGFITNVITALGYTPENVANKQTDLTASATKYPTVNAVNTGLATKEPTITAGTTSQYYRGDKSFQTLDKTAVGLGNVDNTSDASKPVSTAQATAIGLKEDTANKSTSVSTDQASNIKFPSVKSVYDWATGLFATKSMGAYAFRVNNTNATANSTETTYKALGKQTLLTTGFAFTGTTAPSGTATCSYNYTIIGNMVIVTFKALYTVAGSAVTALSIPFPGDLPTPIQPNGFTSASEKLYVGSGALSTSKTTIPTSAGLCTIRNNSANTGFDAVISGASTNVLVLEGTVTYFTS